MTLQEFQDMLHAEYEGNNSTPSSTSAKWLTRVSLLKSSILAWNSESGVLWDELWKLNSAGQSAQTTDGTTKTFAAPTDFVHAGGFVRLTTGSQTTFMEVKKPHEIEIYRGSAENFAFFTGNESAGFTLNFLTAPVTGLTIDYPYYKKPTIPSAVGDDIEMSNPMFALKYVKAILQKNNGDGDGAELSLSEAQAMLSSMRTKNVMVPWHQGNAPLDKTFNLGRGGFGR